MTRGHQAANYLKANHLELKHKPRKSEPSIFVTESLVAHTHKFQTVLQRAGRIQQQSLALTVPPPRLSPEYKYVNLKPFELWQYMEKGKLSFEDNLKPPPDVIVTQPNPSLPSYYFSEGLRRVGPYHFTYNTYCKERWRNRPILEIFADEFRDRPVEYYKKGIESGQIAINGKPAAQGCDTIIKNGDLISHTLHRHEPPVTSNDVGIVHEDDGIMVINKPAGVPVHPAGRYNYNSLVEILRRERAGGPNGWNPLPCNRLDRLTSGIMFIGKHKQAAEELTRQIMGRTIRKEYVARVKGEFPEGDVICERPILQISPKLGLNRVRANGKDAKTVFRRLAYYPPQKPSSKAMANGEKEVEEEAAAAAAAAAATNSSEETNNKALPWSSASGYSIVRCLPLTGRTHQIRVHLQYLGHPITNDPIYSNRRAFGPDLGRRSSSPSHDESIMDALSRMGKTEVADAVAYHEEIATDFEKRKAERQTGEVCDICGTELYSDPGLHELGIYLHARKYACVEGKWSYETPLPLWALPPDGMEGPTEPTEDTDPMNAEELKYAVAENLEKKRKPWLERRDQGSNTEPEEPPDRESEKRGFVVTTIMNPPLT